MSEELIYLLAGFLIGVISYYAIGKLLNTNSIFMKNFLIQNTLKDSWGYCNFYLTPSISLVHSKNSEYRYEAPKFILTMRFLNIEISIPILFYKNNNN